jgi:lipopolysaccharide exporter
LSNIPLLINRGIRWFSLGIIVNLIIQFVVTIIITRLLLPEDFGLIAVITAIIGISEGLSFTGFDSALVQQKGKIEDSLNSVWTIELIKHFLLFSLVFTLAPVLANLLNIKSSMYLIRIVSFAIIFHGTANIGKIYFFKDLDTKRQFFIDTFPDFITSILKIILVYYYRSVLALAIAIVFKSIFYSISTYIYHPYRPKLEIKIHRIRSLFRFSKWVILIALIGQALRHGIPIFISTMFGITQLGYYNRAVAISLNPFKNLTKLLWKISFPAIAKLQDDPVKLKKAVIEGFKMISFFVFPAITGYFIISDLVITNFLTEKWLEISSMLKILILWVSLELINTQFSTIFRGIGRPDIGSKTGMFIFIIILLFSYPVAIQTGLIGLVKFYLAIRLILLSINLFLIVRLVDISIKEILTYPIIALIHSMIMASLLIYLMNVIYGKNMAELLMLIGASATIYFITTYIWDRNTNWGIYKRLKLAFSMN